MDIFYDSVVFMPTDNLPKSDVVIPSNVPEIHKEIMLEFLQSGYFFDRTLNIDRFLDVDSTIDLEKLELALTLISEYLEFSVKSKEPIYVFLGNMNSYFLRRGISDKDLDRVIEESSFILGFCQSIIDNESDNKKFVFQFARGESNA